MKSNIEKKVEWNWNKFNLKSSNTNWFMNRVSETFASYVPDGSKVLEIGCGTGNILTYLTQIKKCNSYGIDISKESKNIVEIFEKQRQSKVNFIVGDGFNIPFKKNSFDVVYSEGVIEHFEDERIMNMVLEHVRVCKKDGLIIISVPNKYNFPLTISKKIMEERYPHYPEKSFTINELKYLIEKSGTNVIAQDGFAWQQGFAFWRILKKSIYLIRYLPDKSLNPKIRSYIGHECMVITKKI